MHTRLFTFSILLFPLMSIYSCTNERVTTLDIDKFIEKYDSVNFTGMKGIFIAQRGGSFFETVYVVGKPFINKPPYFCNIQYFEAINYRD